MPVASTDRYITILPAQTRRLLEIQEVTNAAVGIRQDGSTLHLNTGFEKLTINANGENIQEK